MTSTRWALSSRLAAFKAEHSQSVHCMHRCRVSYFHENKRVLTQSGDIKAFLSVSMAYSVLLSSVSNVFG